MVGCKSKTKNQIFAIYSAQQLHSREIATISYKLLTEYPDLKTELFIVKADSTIELIEQMQIELANYSGGYLEPTFMLQALVNKEDEKYVKQYFYEKNQYRDYAINDLLNSIKEMENEYPNTDSIFVTPGVKVSDYVNVHFNHTYGVDGPIDMSEQKLNWNVAEKDLFKKLNLGEAFFLLNVYRSSIELAKMHCIMFKKRRANN